MGIKIAMLFELLIGVAFVWIIIFQIIVPLLKGTPFFPWLRHKPKEAVAKYAEAVEQKEVAETEAATLAMMGQGVASTVMFAAADKKPKRKTKGE